MGNIYALYPFKKLFRVLICITSTLCFLLFQNNCQAECFISLYNNSFEMRFNNGSLKKTGVKNNSSYESKLPRSENGSDISSDLELKIVPTPSLWGEGINIVISGSNLKKEEVLVILYDVTGKEAYSKVVLRDKGKFLIVIDSSHKLPPGIYLVIGCSKNKFLTKKLIVE